MKNILHITDKDITGSEMLSSAPLRIAVNAIVFDADGNIALCYMGKLHSHTLPGGGVEPGENLHRAVKREIWEETGCDCEIIAELGRITENRYAHDFTQERSYYIAKVVGEKGALHLTDEEIAVDSTVEWHPITHALALISEKHHDDYKRKFIQMRDVAALTEALTWMCLQDIPGYSMFSKIEPISKGWSDDKKYFIETADGKRMLLRVFEMAEYAQKKAEYAMLEKVANHDIPMANPVDFGVCNQGKNAYSLSSWIEGEDAELTLAKISQAAQYNLGVKLGELLGRIHAIPAPEGLASWQARYFAVIDARISAYHTEGVPFIGSEIVLAYLTRNRDLLAKRPQCFFHGDFHEGNLMVSGDGELYAIDWLDEGFGNHGDPWYDFKTFGENENPYYSTGFVRGYFGGEPPEEFWEVLSYYIITAALTSIVWMKYHNPEDLPKNIRWNEENARCIIEGRSPLMKWYLKDFPGMDLRPQYT